MRIVFSKTGYSYANNWIPELRVSSAYQISISDTFGRGTYKARLLEKHFVKTDFLKSSKKVICKDIRGEKLALLRALLKISNPFFFRKALEEEWTLKKLKGNTLFRTILVEEDGR